MKKLFSKIITLVLLVAVLLPHTTIPKVEAAETCNGEWEYHTNYYFFLHAEYPISWAQMTLDYEDDQSNTRNYSRYFTSFLYNFPSDGSTVDFECQDNKTACGSGFVYLDDNKKTVSNNFDPGSDTSRKVWGIADFYDKYKEKYNTTTYTGALSEYQMKDDSEGLERIVTYSYHGDWAKITNSNVDSGYSGYKKSSNKWNLNDLDVQDADDDLTIENAKIRKLINATIYLEPNANSINHLKIGSAATNALSTNDLYDMNDVFRSIKSYSSNKDGRNVVKELSLYGYNEKVPVLDLVIGREYEPEQLFNTSKGDEVTKMTAITQDENGNYIYKVTYNGNEAELDFSKTETSGIYIGEDKVSDKVAVELSNPSDNNEGRWYLAPSLYQISYRVCKTGTDVGTVKVTYDGNESSVNTTAKADKVPAPSDPITVGGSYTVSSQEPTLEGQSFKIWNTDPACGESGKKIEPGAKLENLTNNTTLYACWGPTGSTPEKGTGVLTYAGLFTGIIALAGGAYYLVKKKNIFKKI